MTNQNWKILLHNFKNKFLNSISSSNDREELISFFTSIKYFWENTSKVKLRSDEYKNLDSIILYFKTEVQQMSIGYKLQELYETPPLFLNGLPDTF